ncbi:MAG: alpha-L-fucosidase [Candidatus Sumerlaeota bacterium]|nr:alpha-L-fucosidase [Candidatus Sumerlaeota bacterium]
MRRRDFLRASAAACLALPAAADGLCAETNINATSNIIPSYLKGYEDLYSRDSRGAALQWFVDAKYGLFLHYTLGSLIPGGKPEIKKGGIEWKEVFKKFTAEKFDADAIADLALAARMRYVNLTTRHIGGMGLYRTSTTDFTSVNSPAKRDLVGEMAVACRKRGLGFFVYVPPETARSDNNVFETNKTQLRELLTQYGPLAGVWFDLFPFDDDAIRVIDAHAGVWLDSLQSYYKEPERYGRLSETFALVRSLQPQCLISFKGGALGEVDFLASEHTFERVRGKQSPEAWKKLKDKPVEICTTIQEKNLWINVEGARHKTAEDVMQTLRSVRSKGYNLLLNCGLRGDGSVHPEDEAALRDAGKMIAESGLLGS